MSLRTIDKGSLLLLLLAGCALGLTAGCSRSKSSEPAAPGSCVELPPATEPQTLAAGQTHCFTLQRLEGQVIHGVVEQQRVDVILTLLDPTGKEVWRLDGFNGIVGPETFDAVATLPGSYQLQLAASSGRGHYRIEVDPAHRASRQEVFRARARGELSSGERLRRGVGANPKLALEHFERARDLWLQAGDPDEMDRARFRAGRAFGDLKKWDSAMEIWTALRSHWRGHPLEARLLIEIGNAWLSQGQTENARAIFSEAVVVGRSLGDTENEGSAHSNLGVIFKDQGDFETAAIELRSALSLQATGLDRNRTQLTLANLRAQQGHAREALEIALSLKMDSKQEEIGRLRMIAIASELLAKSDRERADQLHRDAIAAGQQAFRLAEDLGDRKGAVSSRAELASLYFLQDRYPEAEELFLKVQMESRAASDLRALATAWSHLAVIEAEQRHSDHLLPYFKGAREIFEQEGDRAAVAQVFYAEARSLRALGRLEKAQVAITSSIDRVEKLRAEAQQNVASLFFIDLRSRQYDLQIEILMALDEQFPGQRYDRQAFDASELLRARVLLDELAGRADEGLKPETVKTLRRLEKEVRDLQALKTLARASDSLEQKLARAQAELWRERQKIFKESPRYEALMAPRPPSVQEIQRWLDPDTQLISFGVLHNKTYVWQIGARSFTTTVLPLGRERLAQLVDAASLAWKATRKQERRRSIPALRALSDQVLGPLSEQRAVRRLIFIPDGPLLRVPFAALLTTAGASGAEPERFLIEDHEVGLLPSAAVFRELRKLKRAKAGRTLLATIAVSQFPPATGLLPLSQATKEAAAICDLARPLGKVVPFFDGAAQKEVLFSPEVQEARILHFSTHAVVQDADPTRSKIALAGPGDGSLYSPEIYQLQLQADLVVLSACETGVGPQITGEGMISLARGFFYAGAPRVLVSLWPIKDRATSQLMTDFYAALLQGREAPLEALRAAQLKMLERSDTWAAPYYWAGFALQGDWSPTSPTIP